MVKQVTRFICQKCGYEGLKWQGQCEGCGDWNTLVETMMAKKTSGGFGSKKSSMGRQPVKLSQVKVNNVARVKTGIGELDRVLGGGVVPGSVVLLAGEPGIGKSTLLTQLSLKFSGPSTNSSPQRSGLPAQAGLKGVPSRTDLSVLYVCGEESPEQIKLRIDRLGKKSSGSSTNSSPQRSGLKGVPSRTDLVNLSFLAETDVDVVVASVRELVSSRSGTQINNKNKSSTPGCKLGLVIVDSV
ncbi:MAG: AAA family ATPase, partial [Candidatus Beckwithbacteria bacterium]